MKSKPEIFLKSKNYKDYKYRVDKFIRYPEKKRILKQDRKMKIEETLFRIEKKQLKFR